MFKIILINMPFADLNMPSLALTQIKTVIEERFGERVSVEILYLNHDYARYLGMDFYEYITKGLSSHSIGLGEWFFRQAAFPESPDNTERYFARYFPYRSEEMNLVKNLIRDKRQGLDDFAGKLIASYRLAEADLVGFTSMFTQNVASFALARKIKETNPEIITVMGGANCESPMGQEIVKNLESIDFVFSGPGLKSFPDFIECRLAGETEKGHQIKGVFSKRNQSLLQAGAIGEEVPLDVKINLDYDAFLDTFEKNFPDDNMQPTLLFETSRGCWWGQKAHCTFCGLNGLTMAYRSMSPERALEQFESLFKHSSRVSYFQSVDNILPKEYIEDVLPLVETPPHVSLFYEVKADLGDREFEVLSKARVKIVQPGIESLATSTLKLMKKGTTVFQNLSLLKNCLIYDIWPVWNLLVGFPGEEEDVYRKYVNDIPLLVHLPPPNGVVPVRFDRYSPYFVQWEKYDLDLQPLDYYELAYPFSPESLTNFAYYFADQKIGAKYSLVMSMWIDRIREQVNPWLARWFDEDRSRQPKLYFKDDGDSSAVIIDTRSSRTVEHSIGAVARQTLKQLDKPGRIADLNSRLGHIPNYDGAREVAALQEMGLVFQEGDRYMSLTLPSDPLLSFRR